jgi:hypothetical protein
MVEKFVDYATYLLKRTRGGGARLRRPSRERTLTIFPPNCQLGTMTGGYQGRGEGSEAFMGHPGENGRQAS